ncbi:nitric oxide synthase [Trichonephila clavipes]|nr:nitric oxide synthase [Trichonephila clavipes]
MNVTIVDHHTASESFMKHWENEMRLRGGCPADWVWIVPPLSGSLTPVFHQELLNYNLKPSYEYQDPPWKTHIWEKDRESSGNGPRTPSRKFRFKEIARQLEAHWSTATGVLMSNSSTSAAPWIACEGVFILDPLTANYRQLHLQWAHEHRAWQADWHQNVFSGESRFNLWDHDGRIRVRRYAGKHCLPECIIERHSGLTPRVMVWGVIPYHGRFNLPRIEDIPGAIFQQDNAPPHVAKTFRDFCSAQHMQLLPWLAYSPDMSPIEHMWYLVGRRLARDPRPAASKDKLLLRIQAAARNHLIHGPIPVHEPWVAEHCSRRFCQRYEIKKKTVAVICMTDYDIINLEHETLLLVVTSTFGNGDPPENGEAFARSLQAIKVTGETTPDVEYISSTCMPFVRMNSMPLDFQEDEGTNCTPTTELDDDIGPLSNVRFAVFALGSSAYPNFCSFGRYIDTMLGELGGERMVKMGTGDELCGQEHSFSQWAQEAFQGAKSTGKSRANIQETWKKFCQKPRKEAVANFRLLTGHDCLAHTLS